jgi:Protein of unknown function (DUF3048) N-terminal domain/Protein of unknown function (DUF3048) C-terminal domain
MEANMGRRVLVRGVLSGWLAAAVLSACSPGAAPATPPPTVVTATPSVSASPSPVAQSTPTSTPTLAPSPSVAVDPTIADLTGMKTVPALAHRLPIAVTIDDNRVARPQSGFNGASIVYQAPADGGETRYMLVFQEGDSAAIGPVRSGRIYFVHWASEVHAAIAHYGGDRQTRAYLLLFDRTRFTNVDGLGGSGKAFHRISSRAAPHNAYTSTTALRAMVAKHGGPPTIPVDVVRRTFVAPAARGSLPASEHIVIPYRTGRIDYRFDPTSDLYRRYVDGAIQIDQADHRVVTTRNVVVLYMSFRTDSTIERGHARPVVGDIGSGPAVVFREGRRIDGTWSKADDTSPTRLIDASGREIPLVTGRTFFQIVPKGTRITAGS